MDIQELKRDYLRGQEILSKVIDADDHSMEAITLRSVWTPSDLENLQKYLASLKDHGVHLTLN